MTGVTDQVTVSYTRHCTSDVYYPYLQMDAVTDDADRFGPTWAAAAPAPPFFSLAT